MNWRKRQEEMRKEQKEATQAALAPLYQKLGIPQSHRKTCLCPQCRAQAYTPQAPGLGPWFPSCPCPSCNPGTMGVGAKAYSHTYQAISLSVPEEESFTPVDPAQLEERTEPCIGWKVFTIYPGGILHGGYSDWPEKEFHGMCGAYEADGKTAGEHLRKGPRACQCGIYSYRERPQGNSTQVVAQVLNWGVILPYEHGWRAEHCELLQLWLPEGLSDNQIWGLQERYGVPMWHRQWARMDPVTEPQPEPVAPELTYDMLLGAHRALAIGNNALEQSLYKTAMVIEQAKYQLAVEQSDWEYRRSISLPDPWTATFEGDITGFGFSVEDGFKVVP